MKIVQNKIKITKREAVSSVKKTASLLAKFHFNRHLDYSKAIVKPIDVIEQTAMLFDIVLETEHKKDCLDALNDVIEKKYKGKSNKI